MNSATWGVVYFFKIDHKNGYQHVPIHRDSWKFFGVIWQGTYYVFTVLPFGWKSSPYIYHAITEAVAMHGRSLGIAIVVWIDDMMGMTVQRNRGSSIPVCSKSYGGYLNCPFQGRILPGFT